MAKLYTKKHEWLENIEGNVYRIGISEHAQEELGDIVNVELPEVGQEIVAEEECAVIESVKAASDVYSPISGTVTEVNEALVDAPETINQSAEDDGWLFAIDAPEVDESALMDFQAYREFID